MDFIQQTSTNMHGSQMVNQDAVDPLDRGNTASLTDNAQP